MPLAADTNVAGARPATSPAPLPPGSTIGMLGGGQLARMLALAARPMGYRVAVLDPDPAAPAAGLADLHVPGRYDDRAAALELAARADVVTYELEHVDAALVEAVAARVPVRPGLAALLATQDRLAERRLVAELGLGAAPWRPVRGAAELQAAAEALGYPLRLKAAFGGYDGRSQVRIEPGTDVEAALADLGHAPDDRRPLLLERELDFQIELSAIVARGIDGTTATYPPAHNRHDAGILDESIVPAPIPEAIEVEARAIAVRIAEALGAVGVLTVELFLVDGRLVVNELAPRVHNSGHWTIEGAPTSQFEQHVRAICGLPLGPTGARSPAAMVNLLGTGPLRPARLEGLDRALADPSVRVHVYDKRRVFERRKMGHVTALAGTTGEALAAARRGAAAMGWADDTEAGE
jgi:5-(carboxyamino)imidazole ribonucleotide synthase